MPKGQRTLKGIRADLGLTQQEMAAKLGISDVTYRNKEKYATELTASELMLISKLASISPELIKIK